MKFVRYGEPGHEKPGVLDAQGHIRDLSGIVLDTSAEWCHNHAAGLSPEQLPKVGGSPRLGIPYAGTEKIIAVGLNYSDHAAEAGMAIPTEPVLFSKAITSLSGPNDPVIIPAESSKVDWEVELGVVIGKEAKNVAESQAMDYVAGYCLANDVSERELQIERGSGQWFKGKSLDTFCPVGPWLVTADEIPDPHHLNLWLDINGKRKQSGHTGTMIFRIPFLIHYISRYITLKPGDLIITGTPPGVGMGLKPPQFLQHGDVMELGIDGLGTQRQRLVKEVAASMAAPN